ncbi:MAG: twin-arginine translocase TatA/TatE family subunit [Candidatus Marinamargulisbacteria bacterium]
MFGSTEIIVIVLIIFILFGARSIPKFAKSLGEARKEFQKGIDDINDPDKKKNDSSDKPS